MLNWQQTGLRTGVILTAWFKQLLSHSMNTLPASDRPQPQSLRDLFMTFSLMALQGFGGVMAVVQRELVEKKQWLTQEEFVEDWAVAQIMPGPNVINLSIILGGRYFGVPGALSALAGLLVFPLLLLLLIAILYAPYAAHPQVANALRAMVAVAAGLILATGVRLFSALKHNPLGLHMCIALGALCFIAVALLRIPLIYPLFGLGCIACVLVYQKIAP